MWSSKYSTGWCRKSWQPCLLQPECFEAQSPLTLCFLSSCMSQEPSLSHSSFHPLPPPPLCTMQGKAQWNSQEISQPCPFSVVLQVRHREEKKKKREARDASRAPNLQRAERGAAVPVGRQLTVVSPQIGRKNVTLQKSDKRDHPKGVYIKWLS